MKATRRAFLTSSIAAGTLLGGVGEALTGGPEPRSTSETPPRKSTIRIAVVQQAGNPGRVEENRKKALGFAAEALTHSADAILFHEELLVGYVKNARELAETVDGPTVRAFQALLKGSKALILCGLTERRDNRYYIAATVIGADGVVANYRKTHLWWNDVGLRREPDMYTPGDRLVTFDVQGHKSGVMICYDGDFPETTRSYANLECGMLFWMNNRGSRGHEEVRQLAATNSIIIATSCCCGPNENGQICRGGSNITDAKGRLLAEIWDKEGVIYADVRPEEAIQLRNVNSLWRGQRGELYHYPKQ